LCETEYFAKNKNKKKIKIDAGRELSMTVTRLPINRIPFK
jgi:hypothetical protein